MKGVLVGIVCAGLLFSMLSVAPPAKAEATSQELSPTLTYQNSFTMYGDARTMDVLKNRTSSTDSEVNLFDDDPGVLAITAEALDDGEFGTARIEMGLQDPTGEVADYYTVRVYVKTMVVDDFLGNPADGPVSFLDQYTWAWLGLEVVGAETADLEVYYPTDTNIEYADTSGTSWYNGNFLELAPEGSQLPIATGVGMIGIQYHDFDENPLYERPWTLDEVNNMHVYGEFGWSANIFDALAYHQGTLALALAQLYVEVFPADYSPAVNPVGSFIMRPDSDRAMDGWVNESEDDTDLWDSLDETTWSSDWDTTYIHTNDSGELYYSCTFTDPPSWANDTTYAIYPWMIIQSESYTYGEGLFYWSVYPVYEQWETLEMLSIMEFWCNRSVELEAVYSTGEPWTLDQLTVAIMTLTVEAVYQINVSQLAVLCVPLTDVVLDDGVDDDGGAAGIFDFVLSGDGIGTIFAAIGFFGMIAVPALAVYSSREEGIGESFLSGFVLMVLFLGMFLVGVFAQ